MLYQYEQNGIQCFTRYLSGIPSGVSYTEIEQLPDSKVADITIKAIEVAIQNLHDTEAQGRGYDNIASIGKYIGYDNAFRAECEALGAWVAQCWSDAYALLADWEAGNIPDPTVESVLGVMPNAPA